MLARMNRSVNFNRNHRNVIRSQHRDLAKMFLVGIFFLLIVAEVMVRLSNPSERGWLFNTHLGFAIPGLVGLLFVYFKFNGVRHPQVHRYLTRFTLVCILGMILTGVPMFINLSGK